MTHRRIAIGINILIQIGLFIGGYFYAFNEEGSETFGVIVFLYILIFIPCILIISALIWWFQTSFLSAEKGGTRRVLLITFLFWGLIYCTVWVKSKFNKAQEDNKERQESRIRTETETLAFLQQAGNYKHAAWDEMEHAFLIEDNIGQKFYIVKVYEGDILIKYYKPKKEAISDTSFWLSKSLTLTKSYLNKEAKLRIKHSLNTKECCIYLKETLGISIPCSETNRQVLLSFKVIPDNDRILLYITIKKDAIIGNKLTYRSFDDSLGQD